MTIILSIFCISALIGILTYIVIKVTNDDVRTSKALEVPKKPEPTVQISLNLYDKREALEGTYYKVPFSHAAFYIPNFKDTIVYNNSDFIVKEVKRDFNTNNVIITAYKACI